VRIKSFKGALISTSMITSVIASILILLISTTSVSAIHTHTSSIDKDLVKANTPMVLTVTVTNNGPDPVDNVRITVPSAFAGFAPVIKIPNDNVVELAATDNENVVLAAGTKVKLIGLTTVRLYENTSLIRVAGDNVYYENQAGTASDNLWLIDNVIIKKNAIVNATGLTTNDNVLLVEKRTLALDENDVATIAETVVVRVSGNIVRLPENTQLKVRDDTNCRDLTTGDNVTTELAKTLVLNNGVNWVTQASANVKVLSTGLQSTLPAGAWVRLWVIPGETDDNRVTLAAGSKVSLDADTTVMLYENQQVTRVAPGATENVLLTDPAAAENQPNNWTQSAATASTLPAGTYVEWKGIGENRIASGSSLAIPISFTVPAAAGDYTIYVKTKDINGVTDQKTVILTVDNSGPTVQISASPSWVKDNAQVTITVTASEPLAKLENVMVAENNALENTQVLMSSTDKITWTGIYITGDNAERDGLATIYVIGSQLEDLVGNVGSGVTENTFVVKRVWRTSHAPIYIDSNSNFTPANGVTGGSGTENDPYIIENWDIDASSAHGIWINNTTAYFIVRNCYVHDGWNSFIGISLANVINGIVDNNISENNYYGILLSNSDNNRIYHNTCENNSSCGISLYSSDNNIIENNLVGNNWRGVYLYYGSDNNLLSNNLVENNDEEGIFLDSSDNNLVENNIAENNRYGISLDGSYNTISGNIAGNNDECGISLYSSDNNIIENNLVENNWRGVYLYYGSDNNLLSNNLVENNDEEGIFLDSSDNNLVENNIAENNRYGIYLAYSDNNLISGNTCENNSNDGIKLYESSDNNTISGNICSNNYYFGISLFDSSNNVISNNIAENTRNILGIFVENSNNNLIENNTVRNNQQSGIQIHLSSNNTISNNIVEDSRTYEGILIQDSNNNLIENNLVENNSSGIRFEYSGNNIISNNVTGNNLANGIRLDYSDNNLVENNIADNNGDDGIELGESDNNLIFNNFAKNNLYNGIVIWNSDYNIIENNLMENNHYGINFAYGSDNNIIENNTVENNGYGIYLASYGSDNNLISNNTVENNNYYGIYLDGSENNTLYNNTCGNNGEGIYLYSSFNIKMRNNTLSNNRYNFGVEGIFVHDIDTSNLVNGKPIRYLVDNKNEIIGPSLEMGYLALVNCDNIRVENLALGNNEQGILLAGTKNSWVENCTLENSDQGIDLYYSSNDTLDNNTCSNNFYGIRLSNSSNNFLSNNACENNGYGIYLYYSDNNLLSNNTVENGYNPSIELEYSDNNLLFNNTLENNRNNGIRLHYSDNNFLSNNTVENNFYDGINLSSSSNNIVSNNIMENNNNGIRLDGPNNFLSNNVCSNNNEYGIRLDSSFNTLDNNSCSNNYYGIRLGYSSNNTLDNNSCSNNRYNFGVRGDDISYFTHDIDNSNLVNGKPIRYLKGENDLLIGPSYGDIGYLALVGCDNIRVENLVLGGNGEGILLVDTSRSMIINSSFANNESGIYLKNSRNNFISNNVGENNGYGIYLYYSDNNFISNNAMKNNYGGIYLYNSNNNLISGNTFTNDGLWVDFSYQNTVENNTVNGRPLVYLEDESDQVIADAGQVILVRCENITVENLNLSNTSIGVELWETDNSKVMNNIAGNNSLGIYLSSSNNNLICHNNIVNNATQALDGGSNHWDNGYPSGGNYWSDYTGVDENHGEDQDISGSDGIGDVPYHIWGGSNQDRYPLIFRGVQVVITPPSQENDNGGTLKYDVSVKNLGNVQENFQLTRGDNAGWTLSLDNNWLSIPNGENRTTMLRVTIPANATGCTWDNIWVKATSKDNTAVFDNKSCLAHAAVALPPKDNTPPPAPSLVSPANGENLNDNTPTLDWSAVSDNSLPVLYYAAVSDNSAFPYENRKSGWIAADNWEVSPALPDGVWYWRVRAKDNAGNVGDNSSTRSFRIDVTPPPAQILISPANGENTTDNTPTFIWAAVTDPSGVTYTLEIIGKLTKTGVKENTYTLTSIEALAVGNYSWRIRAIDGAGNEGAWSNVWTFTVSAVMPPPSFPQAIMRISRITPDAPATIEVENVKIIELSINVTRAVENVKITIQELTDRPTEIAISAPGVVYRYLNIIKENITDNDIGSVTITFKVEKSWIEGENIDENTITLKRYNPENGGWVSLPTVKVSEDATYVYFSATSPGLSYFAVSGTAMTPAPAAFTVSSLTISPSQVSVGEEVSISVTVTNTGDLAGTYTVTLKINGIVENTENVTLAGGATELVVFTVAGNKEGTYSVEVNGLAGTFTVITPPIGLALPIGIIVVIAIITIGATIVVRRQKLRRILQIG